MAYKANRIDWQKISAKWGSEVSVPHLAVLPKGFCQLVLAISERWQWEATYRQDGVLPMTESEWDDLQAIVADGLKGMVDTVPLSDLLTMLDDVEPLLESILAAIGEDDNCCDQPPPISGGDDLFDPYELPGGGQIFPVGDDPTELPDPAEWPINPITDPDDDGIVTPEDINRYLCGALNWLFNSWVQWYRFGKFAKNLYFTITALIEWIAVRIIQYIFPGFLDDIILMTGEQLAELIQGTWRNLSDAVFDAGIAELESLRDEIICAMIEGATWQDAWNTAKSLLNASTIDAAMLSFLYAGPWGVIGSFIWNGLIDATWRDDCTCPGPITFRKLNGTDDVTEAITGGGTGQVGVTYNLPVETHMTGIRRLGVRIYVDGVAAMPDVTLTVGGTYTLAGFDDAAYNERSGLRDTAMVWLAPPCATADEAAPTPNQAFSCEGHALAVTGGPNVSWGATFVINSL